MNPKVWHTAFWRRAWRSVDLISRKEDCQSMKIIVESWQFWAAGGPAPKPGR